MMLSQCDKEDILLNKDTLWAGLQAHNNIGKRYIDVVPELVDASKYVKPSAFVENYMVGQHMNSYTPLGLIKLNFGHIDVSGYVRALNLFKAIYTCDYICNGAKYRRECFVSRPHMNFAQKFTRKDVN